jgi:hypothetical protein
MGFVLTVAVASHGNAQHQQLVGTWLLVSEITVVPDGKRFEGFGGNQKGILIFDRTGHYSSQLTGDELTLGVARTSSGGQAELVWKRAE